MKHQFNKVRSARGAKTLAQRYYCAESVFAEEQEKIFSQQWVYIRRSHELRDPGDYLVVDVCGESIIVTLEENGELRAFYNVCSHRGARLCQEEKGQSDGRFRCAYHAWTYASDGRLVGAPNMLDTPGFDREAYGLQEVAVAEWEGGIFVNLAVEPIPFRLAYAAIYNKFRHWKMSELEVAHQTVYNVKANWKLLFQNYSECYHCPSVHPQLNRLTVYTDSTNDLDEGPFLGGPMLLSDGIGSSMSMTGKVCAPPLPALNDEDQQLIYYYTLSPNMFLSLHPDYVLIHRLRPLGVGETEIVCEWLFHPQAMAAPGFDPAPAVEFWDLTNREDWHLCEISQQGISSRGYRPGPYSELESQLAAFDRNYLRLMEL